MVDYEYSTQIRHVFWRKKICMRYLSVPRLVCNPWLCAQPSGIPNAKSTDPNIQHATHRPSKGANIKRNDPSSLRQTTRAGHIPINPVQSEGGGGKEGRGEHSGAVCSIGRTISFSE